MCAVLIRSFPHKAIGSCPKEPHTQMGVVLVLLMVLKMVLVLGAVFRKESESEIKRTK